MGTRTLPSCRSPASRTPAEGWASLLPKVLGFADLPTQPQLGPGPPAPHHTHTPHYCGRALTGTWPGFPPGSRPCLTEASPPCPMSPCPLLSSGLVSLPLMLLDQPCGKGFAVAWGREGAWRHSEAGKLRASTWWSQTASPLSVCPGPPSESVFCLVGLALRRLALPHSALLLPKWEWGPGHLKDLLPGGCPRLSQAHFFTGLYYGSNF